MSPASYQTAPPRAEDCFRGFQAALKSKSQSFNSASESGKRDSNPRPQPWQGCALPTELFPRDDSVGFSWPVRTVSLLQRPRIRQPSARLTVQPPSGGEGDRTPDLVNAIHAL